MFSVGQQVRMRDIPENGWSEYCGDVRRRPGVVIEGGHVADDGTPAAEAHFYGIPGVWRVATWRLESILHSEGLAVACEKETV